MTSTTAREPSLLAPLRMTASRSRYVSCGLGGEASFSSVFNRLWHPRMETATKSKIHLHSIPSQIFRLLLMPTSRVFRTIAIRISKGEAFQQPASECRGPAGRACPQGGGRLRRGPLPSPRAAFRRAGAEGALSAPARRDPPTSLGGARAVSRARAGRGAAGRALPLRGLLCRQRGLGLRRGGGAPRAGAGGRRRGSRSPAAPVEPLQPRPTVGKRCLSRP